MHFQEDHRSQFQQLVRRLRTMYQVRDARKHTDVKPVRVDFAHIDSVQVEASNSENHSSPLRPARQEPPIGHLHIVTVTLTQEAADAMRNSICSAYSRSLAAEGLRDYRGSWGYPNPEFEPSETQSLCDFAGVPPGPPFDKTRVLEQPGTVGVLDAAIMNGLDLDFVLSPNAAIRVYHAVRLAVLNSSLESPPTYLPSYPLHLRTYNYAMTEGPKAEFIPMVGEVRSLMLPSRLRIDVRLPFPKLDEKSPAVTIFTHHAALVSRGSQLAAGYDLQARVPCTLTRANPIASVPTGLCLWVTDGPPSISGSQHLGRAAMPHLEVRSRSGLALKGLTVANAPGTVDLDYEGEICAIMSLHASEALPFMPVLPSQHTVNPGDRIAQAVPNNLAMPYHALEVRATEARGVAGFGSTGVGSPGA